MVIIEGLLISPESDHRIGGTLEVELAPKVPVMEDRAEHHIGCVSISALAPEHRGTNQEHPPPPPVRA